MSPERFSSVLTEKDSNFLESVVGWSNKKRGNTTESHTDSQGGDGTQTCGVILELGMNILKGSFRT